MSELSLKQFVPSSVCLKCDGCCRFQSNDSPWRPKWNKKEFTDAQNYVTTLLGHAGCHSANSICRFFNEYDHTCQVYHDRPFECELYPFLLSKHPEGIKVFMHLACPYVQDHQGHGLTEQYVNYLKVFFNEPGTLNFLKQNEHLVHDYSAFKDEIQYLFDLPSLKFANDDILAQKPLVEEYLARGARPLSSHHFTSIFAWKDFFKFTFEIIEDHLCIFARQNKESFLYLPPLGGELKSATLQACFERMGASRIARVENISDNQLLGLQGYGYNAYLKAYEYLYLCRDLVNLAGSAYKSKRHDIHVFEQRYSQAEFRPYTASDYDDCQVLYKTWADNRKASYTDQVYLNMLDENEGVHAALMFHATQLDLVGWVVTIDGKIAGYTFGYKLDEQTFCVLLEITDLIKIGVSAYMFNQFCTYALEQGFHLINTMDDFGMPQVAKTKGSYHPIKQLPVYSLTKGK